ncbi:MAG: phage tail protein [Oscillospiraceae bacterium]|nr:phage tail protein [Oscillospiraceae bacterium]
MSIHRGRKFVDVLDRQRKPLATLRKASEIREDEAINSINFFHFSLPDDDPMNMHCRARNLVQYGNGKLYRIMKPRRIYTEKGNRVYRAEHVWATLKDDFLEFTHQRGGLTQNTRDVLEYILSFQTTKHWVLGECDFDNRFEYGWTDETLSSAINSVVNVFVEPYIWTFDTNVYPWRMNLKRLTPSAIPDLHIEAGRNMIRVTHEADFTKIVTELHPRGYGEGINTLTIASVNNGQTFLRSPQKYIDEYGLIRKPITLPEYENPHSLKAVSQALLNELQEPLEQYEVDFALLGEADYEKPAVGKLVEIVGFKRAFITGILWNHDEIPNSVLQLANRPRDIAGNLADMMNRMRINMTYAQGATQFFQSDKDDNAAPAIPLRLRVDFPSELRIINWVRLDVEVEPFRAQVRATQGGGARTETSGASSATSSGPSTSSTTSSGGGSSQTSSSGGGGSQTSSSGGGGTVSSTQNIGGAGAGGTTDPPQTDRTGSTAGPGAHTHDMWHVHWVNVTQHTHNVTIQAHTHSVTFSAHSHSVTIPAHSHGMAHTHNIAHTHTLTLPNHEHTIIPGMTRHGNPTSFTIRVNGVNRLTVSGRRWRGSILEWIFDHRNEVPRDRIHNFEIIPNDNAYVYLKVSTTGFIQSHGGVVA